MNNKKVGLVLLVIGILVAIIITQLVFKLNSNAEEAGCFGDEACGVIEYQLDIAHFAFGLIGFILALGFYLLFFSKGEQEILNRLEENKAKRSNEEEFNLILKGLGSYEKKVLGAIREQNGITQNTLRIRTDMSKAKLSYVLKDLEEKNLVKREKKGKTLAVFLKIKAL
jgi:uncharacterized membrane protein